MHTHQLAKGISPWPNGCMINLSIVAGLSTATLTSKYKLLYILIHPYTDTKYIAEFIFINRSRHPAFAGFVSLAACVSLQRLRPLFLPLPSNLVLCPNIHTLGVHKQADIQKHKSLWATSLFPISPSLSLTTLDQASFLHKHDTEETAAVACVPCFHPAIFFSPPF